MRWPNHSWRKGIRKKRRPRPEPQDDWWLPRFDGCDASMSHNCVGACTLWFECTVLAKILVADHVHCISLQSRWQEPLTWRITIDYNILQHKSGMGLCDELKASEDICYRYITDNKSAANEQGLIGDIGGQWYRYYADSESENPGRTQLQVPKAKTAEEEKESAEAKRAAIAARVAAAKAEQEKDPASAALILSRRSGSSKKMQGLSCGQQCCTSNILENHQF